MPVHKGRRGKMPKKGKPMPPKGMHMMSDGTLMEGATHGEAPKKKGKR